ncbi:MAG: type VI secretion system lipoprotein TssJ [Myxococcales bacterium]
MPGFEIKASKALGGLVFVTCAALGVGCAGARPSCKVPTRVELELETSDRVNQDEKGRSLPTVVRLYQLEDLSRFQQSSFEDVWQQPEESLGPTLVGSDELTIFPGQIMVHRFERDESADFLVGVAVFRTPIGGSWRTIQEWPLPGDPCAEQDEEDLQPTLQQLRLRMFLERYRIVSVNNYGKLAKRRCPPDDKTCEGAGGDAPDELPEALRGRRLRTFEEDSSAPRPTVGAEAQEPPPE